MRRSPWYCLALALAVGAAGCPKAAKNPFEEKSTPELTQALDDASNPAAQAEAAYFLSQRGAAAKDAIPSLMRGLESPDRGVRQNAALALGKIGPEAAAAVPALMKLLRDPEYLVRVHWAPNGPRGAGVVTQDVQAVFPPERLALLRHGLSLDDQPLRPARVDWQNPEQLRFVLTEGKKRQIRRMCELVGLKVVGLKRIRIGNVVLGQLPQGQWRYLGADERF